MKSGVVWKSVHRDASSGGRAGRRIDMSRAKTCHALCKSVRVAPAAASGRVSSEQACGASITA